MVDEDKLKEIQQGMFKKKKEPSFGKPKDSWTFGKKPSKGSFGKNPSKGSFGTEEVTLKSGRKKPVKNTFIKRKPAKIKKFHLVLPDYMKFLHEKNEGRGMDVHHWRTRSDIGRNDFFVVMLEHDYHINTVHGKMSARGYRDLIGIDELNEKSFLMFAEWLADPSCKDFERGYFKQMLIALKDSEFKDSIATVRSFAEDYNSMTKAP